jgi:Flp pilus assembly pilin Flp
MAEQLAHLVVPLVPSAGAEEAALHPAVRADQSIRAELANLERTLATGRPPVRRTYRGLVADPRPQFLVNVLQHECAQLRARRPAPGQTWWVDAAGCLRDAHDAVARGDIEGGWAFLHQAHRLQVHTYSVSEIQAEVSYIRREASCGKFRPAQRELICEQLDRVVAVLAEWADDDRAHGAARAGGVRPRWRRHSPQPVGRGARDGGSVEPARIGTARAALIGALLVRDRCYANAYYELALVRRYQVILLVVALCIVGAALVGSVFANPNFEAGVQQRWTAVGAALGGALGGITSALQRTTRRQRECLPEKVGSLVAPLSRPVIGAIAGMSVFLAVRAGITQPSDQQVAYLLLVAFGAGFAERLVVRDPREESAEMMRAASVPPNRNA